MTGIRLMRAALLLAMTGLGASPVLAGTLYVTNTKADSATLIDTTTLEVIRTIPLGKGKPNRIAFHPDGKTAWVVYDKSHDLGVIDAETHRLIKRVRIGGNPYNLAFSPDGRHLYVLDWSSETSKDEVIIYDLAAERVDGRIEVSTWPAHGIFLRSGKTFYVAGETAGNLALIDTDTRTITHTLWTGGDAMGLALTTDQRWLYAAGGEERKLVKVDTRTNLPVGDIRLPGIVHDAVLTLDDQFLYATLRKANLVAVVRTADDRLVTTIPQPGYPDLVTMEPSGRHAFVTNRYADVVTVIDVKTHKVVKVIPVGKAPHGMALRPETNRDASW
ncbi:MAG: beta-propeller fold lactonase family protein [Actinomycetota bacterium]